MTAYYNEIDPYAAQWLRNLIAAGHIAPGDVDERSILDVEPKDLAGYLQCHFFAGIGVWSYALRLADWPDERPVWTGSCPCQPFSIAGKGTGTADERHLWPVWFDLVRECRPATVFGEQVEAAIKHGWLDLVQSDLEGIGYAFGAAGIPAAGVGAPHIRQRLWFVADRMAQSDLHQHQREKPGINETPNGSAPGDGAHLSLAGESGGTGRNVCGMADATAGRFGIDRCTPRTAGHAAQRNTACCLADHEGERCGKARTGSQRSAQWAGQRSESGGVDDARLKGLERFGIGYQAAPGWNGTVRPVAEADESDGMEHSGGCGWQWRETSASRHDDDRATSERQESEYGFGVTDTHRLPGNSTGPTNDHWRDADWLFCRDGKWRPVEPGTFPLAHGIANRVGRLRAYGNSIVAQAAREVIAAFMECRP